MITLDSYHMMEENKRKLVEVSIVSILWKHLDDGNSISVAKKNLVLNRSFSQNIINYVYNNNKDIKTYVANARTKKLKLRGISY